MAARWRMPVLLVFALHIALGAALGLSVDEAHYALYARHLALSYFDHPPLVGWVQWPLVALHAPVVVLRLIPGALWLGTVVLVWHTTVLLQPHNRAAPGWAVLTLLLAPLLHVLGIALLPDTLLVFLGSALMLLTLQMCQVRPAPHRGQTRPAPRLGQWLLLGLLLGLAGLSKYTAVFTALAVALCLLQAHGLRLLRSGGLWLSILLALLLVAPIVVWNAQHGWISFAYQLNHGTGNAWQWQEMLRYVAVQLLAFGPLLLWGGAGVLQTATHLRMGVAFFVLPFGVIVYLSGGGTGLPHWTAPAWVALAPWAGVALARSWQSARLAGCWVMVGFASLQGLACVGLFVLMLGAGMPWMQGKVADAHNTNPPNPFADLYGWDAAGATARSLAQQQGLGSVAVQNWTLASRMAWYASPLPVHVLEDRFDQFDLWAGDLPPGGSALLVDWSQQSYITPLGEHGFAHCEQVGHQAVQRLGFALASFDFYACKGWSGKPAPRLREGTAP